ncbi:MAG TPA: carboxypeptidase regulatory-like domain-containing protein, partial [Planctomycetota bacterium]|nr:carboxypeptidase regulatory-like domain-containing protein [Planctomycetota bacterium]
TGRAPVAGVEVRLAASDALPLVGAVPRPGSEEQKARSGPDGRFEFRVPAGRDLVLRLASDDWYVREPRGGALSIAALDADRDVGDVQLGRAAHIAGVVQNEAGVPIEGVRVMVSTARLSLWFGPGSAALVTDARGRFERGGLSPGKYTITTASPEYMPGELELTLDEGERRSDVVLTLAAGKAIAGIVVDDLGTPLAGMKVAAERARELSPGVRIRSSNTAEAATTDAAGRFVLRGLDAATADVTAWGPGHVRATVPGVAVGTSDLTVRLDRYGSIAGRVVDAAGSGVAGSSVRVRSAGAAGFGPIFEPEDTVQTDADGRFIVAQVVPGSAVVVVEGKEHAIAESSPVDVRPGQRTDGVEIVVQRGASVLVTVTDAAGRPIAGAKVAVREPEATVQPAAFGGMRRGMRVRRGPEAGNVAFDDPGARATGTTGADGKVTIAGLQPGQLVVHATHERYAGATTPVLTLEAAGEVRAELTLHAGGFLNVQAVDTQGDPLPGASFRLRGPLDGEAEPRTEDARCDDAGLARVGPLLPGRWRVALVAAPRPIDLGGGMPMMVLTGEPREFAETATTVEVTAEQTTDVRLVRPQLATLRGTVSDAQGRVAGAKIRVAENSGPALPFGGGATATTAADGTFSISDLASGKYVLSYGYGDALAMCEEPLEIAAGQVLVERTLVLRTGAIKLCVRGEDGEPVAGARVNVDRPGTRGAPRSEVRMVAVMRGSGPEGGGSTSISTGTPAASTDALGEVEIERVPEGDYELRIEHPQHVTTTKSVKVLEGAVAEVGTVVLPPGGELRGRVLGADGQPVEVANVEVVAKSGTRRREVALDGTYRIGGLAADTYRVTASIPGEGGRSGKPVDVTLAKGERRTVDLKVE